MQTKQEANEAKQRVKEELSELCNKITSLTSFLHGAKILEAKISTEMRDLLEVQLRTMQDYARILQQRLQIWESAS